MFNTHRSSRNTPGQVVKLWQHEMARTFHDRIVDKTTRKWFNTTMDKVSALRISQSGMLAAITKYVVYLIPYNSW